MKLIKNFKTFSYDIVNERLMNVDDDVDMIYNLVFRDIYDKIKITGNVKGVEFKNIELSSSELKSPLCIKANKINPIKILINESSFNYYDPKNKIISIAYPKQAFDYVMKFNGNIKRAAKDLEGYKSNSILREFKESTIKGSIHHELIHWIDDSLHNQHIDKILKNNIKGIPNVNSKQFEIQAQIHNIKQLKNKYSYKWNELYFDDMIKLSPILSTVINNLPKELSIKWKQDIKRRMYREGLLGKKMNVNR